MTTNNIDLEKLKAPFPPERISWRVGATLKDKTKGIPFAYIDARDVMDRLDGVCGPEGWQNKYSHANGKTVCDIGIICKGEWVWKADGSGDSDVEAEKGALSDAFKRAAVRWGIGRYLYDIHANWVAIEPKGNSYIISPKEMPKLIALLPIPDGKQPEDKLLSAAHAFEERLNACISLDQVTSLITNNGKLLLALKEQKKDLFESMGKEISKTQEAFHLSQ